MSLPTLASALGAPSTTPTPGLADGGWDLPGPHGTTGGFAAALDEATAGLEAQATAVLEGAMPALPGLIELPVPPLPAPALPTATPAILSTVPTAVDATTLATPGDTAPTASAPGWPPPGLSSLFPAAPVLAAQAGAQAVAGALGSVRGAFAALLPDASSASAADSGSAVPASLLAATPPGSNGAIATPVPAGHGIAPEAVVAALARQPAPLRLPVADEADTSAVTALTEALGIERSADAAPTALAAPTPTLHKLDLAQAFPAPVPLPSPRFAEEVGARLQWIAEQQGGEATLRISPEGLGPVEVRMKLDGDRVDLGFAATQQDTRQALQDALPKLREMLAQQGLQLGQADVGQKHAQSSNDEASKTARGLAADDEGEGVVVAPQPRESTLVIGRGGRGVLDLYA